MQHDTKQLIAKAVDLMLDAVCVVDREGRFTFVSAACESVFGYKPEEMVGRPMIDFVYAGDRERTLEAAGQVMSGKSHLHFRNRYVRKDGSLVHIMWSARFSADQMRIAVARDITELVYAESLQAAVYAISEAAHAGKDLLALFRRVHAIVAGLLPVGNFIVTLCDEESGEITFPYAVYDSDPSAIHSDLDAEALCVEMVHSGRDLLSAHSGTVPTAGGAQLAGPDALQSLGVPLHSQKGVIGALLIQNHSGATRYTEKDKELLQFVSAQIATAIERKRAEMRLQHLALHDVLTNLPNRELFYDRLENALARAKRNHVHMGLLYLDLDGFKQVNDCYGHAVGDALLREVAQRIKLCVRGSDTVGRVGGDEFVVVLDGIGAPEDATLVAEKIRTALKQSFELNGHALHIAPSIGIAMYPQHGTQSAALMRYADAAMYAAKAQGKDRVWMDDGSNATLGTTPARDPVSN